MLAVATLSHGEKSLPTPRTLPGLTHHVNILELNGDSYRLGQAAPEISKPRPDRPSQDGPCGPMRHGTRQLCGTARAMTCGTPPLV